MTDDDRELSKSDELVRSASTKKLEQAQRVYAWVTKLSFLAIIVCAVLGIWVDYRWLWTALVPLFTWTIANFSDDKVRAELRRRVARGQQLNTPEDPHQRY